MSADEVIQEANKAKKEAETSAAEHAAKAEAAGKETPPDTAKQNDEQALENGARARAAAAKKAKEAAQKSKQNAADNPAQAAIDLVTATSELDKATVGNRIFKEFGGETNKDLDERLLELVDFAKNWLAANPGKKISNWPDDACRRKAGANLGKLGVVDPNPPKKQNEMTKFLKELVEAEGTF